MATTTTKTHVPNTGKSSGLLATSECGRGFRTRTGDHQALVRAAMAAVGTPDEARYCARCMARVKAAMV